VSNSGLFLNLLRGRRSVRRFREKSVDRSTLARLLEAASWAPSASNRQDWVFCVVTSPMVKAQMADAVRTRWDKIIAANRNMGAIDEIEHYASHFAEFARAPVVIAIGAKTLDAVQRHLLGEAAAVASGAQTSAAMAAENLMLAAHALGLGSCCMTGALAARAELAKILNLGKRDELICLIALGWPDEAPLAPARKPMEEIARFIE
jgi:nitroreductase